MEYNIRVYKPCLLYTSLYRSQAKESVKRRIRAMHKIRLLVREILQIQQENCSDQELKKAQEQLNRLYDAFVKTHGYFCDRTNKMAFRQDNDYPLSLIHIYAILLLTGVIRTSGNISGLKKSP